MKTLHQQVYFSLPKKKTWRKRCSMENYTIGCDAHKKYSQFSVMDSQGKIVKRARVEHTPGAIQKFLLVYPKGTQVALECVGNWYWIVDEIEAASCVPRLTNPGKAKLMMGHVNKTDKLDADGVNLLLFNGTLPTVWIPDRTLRDERELPRTRMAIAKYRTAVKNRIHATLSKHGIHIEEESDIFSGKGLKALVLSLDGLPPESRRCVEEQLALLNDLQGHISNLEKRMREVMAWTPSAGLIDSLPGVGDVLSMVIDREIGEVSRFPSGEHLASYAGLTPTVHASGGKVYYGPMRKQSQQSLKWAYVEAANVIVRVRHHPNWRHKHAVRLYEATAQRRGHAVAVGAVARHLCEASYWMLKKGEEYREPHSQKDLPKQG
jgi:transposase